MLLLFPTLPHGTFFPLSFFFYIRSVFTTMILFLISSILSASLSLSLPLSLTHTYMRERDAIKIQNLYIKFNIMISHLSLTSIFYRFHIFIFLWQNSIITYIDHIFYSSFVGTQQILLLCHCLVSQQTKLCLCERSQTPLSIFPGVVQMGHILILVSRFYLILSFVFPFIYCFSWCPEDF